MGSSTHGSWLGSYEYDKQRRFAQEVKKGAVVYDIGAHVGYYTLLAPVLVGCTGKVVAFEPLPRNLRYLRHHLALNHITNVTVIEAVASQNGGTAFFDEGPDSSMGFVSEHGCLEVKAVSLDELYSAGAIPAPGFIKMDIEGGEYKALIGAQNLLSNTHPVILLQPMA